jgi:hypothetical protein
LFSNKPRTYRRKARKYYLNVAKNKKISDKSLKQAIRKQLNYVKRDLKHLEKINPVALSVRQYTEWQTIKKFYEQQKYMFETGTRSVPGDIPASRKADSERESRSKGGIWSENIHQFGKRIG